MHIDSFKTLNGLYALTADGRLGVYDETGRLTIDDELSATLRETCQHLLQTYLSKKSDSPICIGLVYPTREPRPWKTDTLFLEESVVRQLFPAGDVNSPLTGFQKRNQEHSLYRGMELLLAAHNKDASMSMWCPVLFNCEAMLSEYASVLRCEEKSINTQTPAIEVLNLFTGLSAAQRDVPAFRQIEEKTRAALAAKNTRRENMFTLIEQVNVANTGEGGYYDADSRSTREVTLNADSLAQLHQVQRHEGVERWLEIPHRPINPGDLRRFVQFAGLSPAALDALAGKSYVYTAPENMTLLDCGMTDRWNMYLLEGTLMLEAKDGQALTVEGGTPAAASPIAFLKPRKYKVTSMSRVSFIWIHDALINALGIGGGRRHSDQNRVAPNTFSTAHRTAVRR